MAEGQYCYRVRAFNSETHSEWSEDKCTAVGDGGAFCDIVTVGYMSYERINQQLTVFDHGGVLITGGDDGDTGLSLVEYYHSGNVYQLEPLHYGRSFHAAVAISDREVLILGGNGLVGECIAYHERYDIHNYNETEPFPIPEQMRYFNVAAKRLDAQYILMYGGRSCYSDEYNDRLIKYDFINDDYEVLDQLVPMDFPEIIAAEDGKFFISDGCNTYQFDPLTNKIDYLGRNNWQACGKVALAGGNELLITGGSDWRPYPATFFNNAALATNKGTVPLSQKLRSPRGRHNSEMLPNGNVVIFNGLSEESDYTVLDTIEIYDVTKGRFEEAGRRSCVPSGYGGDWEFCYEFKDTVSAVLPNGQIISTGGYMEGFYRRGDEIDPDHWFAPRRDIEIISCNR
jgi:hypothetical protein